MAAAADPDATAGGSTELSSPLPSPHLALPTTSSPAESTESLARQLHRAASVSSRSSICKSASAWAPQLSAFERLPDEIIQQILVAVDPSSFASLILINSKWRAVSQQAHVYAHHLSRSPSYAASHKTFLARFASRQQSDSDGKLLQDLRRDFAREVKRNRFDAYLRPNRTLVRIVSNSISSSSCPGGDGLQFQASPRGHHLLAYNSSRIYLLDLRGPTVEVSRELKILRRPVAICVRDDASTLVVLLTEMQVDLYDLRQSPPRRTQSIILDHSPRAIALSPCGSVLAAAYDSGIEVSSLNSAALATDRRAVKCDAVDALAFSYDGTQILGTTVHAAQPTTVILTAPYYDPGSLAFSDDMSGLWTTSILFPNTSRDCSHAVLLQDSAREEAFWTFAYDSSFETFRAVRIDDLRNGTTYFTGPVPTSASQARLLPCTLPAASYHGDLVSAGFQGKEIWLYGVPEDLDAVPDLDDLASGGAGNLTHTSSRASGSPSIRAASTRLQESGNSPAVRVPQWQLLCDKLRNTFTSGYLIGELPGVSMVKWVEGFGESSLRERLVVCAPGILPPKPLSSEDDGFDFIDGGRLLLVDFDYGLSDGRTSEVTIEVGNKKPEVLEEERRDLDTEVAIVRRRTVAQKKTKGAALMRSATTVGAAPLPPVMPPLPSGPSMSSAVVSGDDDDDPLLPRRIGTFPTRQNEQSAAAAAAAAPAMGVPGDSPVAEDGVETEYSIEEQEAFDAPYSQGNPRSVLTLRRAATAAAISRRLNPPPATTASGVAITYRRADGRREHPHESDADNWVPPPPPYQKEDPQDLPAFMRHNVAPITAPISDAQAGVQASVFPVDVADAGAPVPGSSGEGGKEEKAPAAEFAEFRQQSQLHQGPLPANDQPPSSFSGLGIVPASQTASRPTSQSASFISSAISEDIYDASPRATPAPPAVTYSTGATSTSQPLASEASVLLITSTGSPEFAASMGFSGPPTLNLQIPSPSLSTAATWNHTTQPQDSQNVYAPKPLGSVQTWPLRRPADSAQSNALSGSPYSAPPTLLEGYGTSPLADAGPPQLASAQPYSSASESRQSSLAGIHVPRMAGWRMSHFRRPSAESATVAPRAGNDTNVNTPLPAPNGQQSLAPGFQQPPLHHPQPVRIHGSSGSPSRLPAEDQPLIISTPQGVSGAFDPPGQDKYDRQQDTPILAPVARRPQAQERSAQLRERLEVMSGGDPGPAQEPNVLSLPAGGSGYQSSGAATTRQSSLSRKQSRAERSAAKNIADAKRRGWRGQINKRSKGKDREAADSTAESSGTVPTLSSLFPQMGSAASADAAPTKKRRSKKKARDFDAASSAAWTDVTAVTAVGSGIAPYYQQQQGMFVSPLPTGPDSSSAYAMQQMQQMQMQLQMHQQQQQEQVMRQQHEQFQYYDKKQRGDRGKEKCAVM